MKELLEKESKNKEHVNKLTKATKRKIEQVSTLLTSEVASKQETLVLCVAESQVIAKRCNVAP